MENCSHLFFFAETFRSFVPYTVVLKPALTVFTSLPFQALWPNRHTFSVIWTQIGLWPKKQTQSTLQSHTNNGFFKHVETLLQIHACFFSHNMKLRALPLSAVTVSLHYLPRCSIVAVHWQNAFCCSLKYTFEDLLPCYCHAIKPNDRTICAQVSQHATARKRADMSELQAHHCLTREEWTWLLCKLSVPCTRRLTVQTSTRFMHAYFGQ